ncbi:helix-turn-helix domain-containing protein [Salmonella enterica subsp. enterica]|nr:helix-turn-helix domain-containing protein [Salmonella enterica]EAW3939495.1 helix-turn-helix domain-containing protein [Salmonella enterica subsp. enterica]EAW4187475.1 helix-turn-helix domain-containing protein [Salmonella enterica subsp. enterica]EAW4265917.1 helix-turn-helix domain-containing protein [Salmonella enterica subsp. enterica]EAW4270574.1 helix-turn-helix domain-containing protein [Salmonella enterica subsp. enterica]
MSDNKTLGARTLQRRKLLKLTQRELAQRVGVVHVTISQWERDETHPVGARLFSLARSLSCDPSWLLFGGEGENPPPPNELPAPLKLSKIHQELIELFDSLPESEQKSEIQSLRVKSQYFDKLYKELKVAAKRKNK